MKTMRNEIELRLIGSMLSDWCKQRAEKDDKFIYQSSFDSTHRVIRFATPMLKSLLALPQSRILGERVCSNVRNKQRC